MVITKKLGRVQDFDGKNYSIDWLPLEWYETGKRILHKRTAAGLQLTLKFLKEAPQLQQDDVLHADENQLVAVTILPCEAIVIHPANLYQMALACYEIGNKHLPLFYENEELLIPYEAPLFRMLQALEFNLRTERRQLLHPLKTSVAPHGHTGSTSLFSKILQLTAGDAS